MRITGKLNLYKRAILAGVSSLQSKALGELISQLFPKIFCEIFIFYKEQI